jgi:hypothetical protein
VAYYLQSLPEHTVNPVQNRIKLLKPLPKPIGNNKEIQPLAGVIRPEYIYQPVRSVATTVSDATLPASSRQRSTAWHIDNHDMQSRAD